MKKLSRAQRHTLSKIAPTYIQDQQEHLARHRGHCEICNHPACSFIQEAFLQWVSPATIMKKYDLKSRATIYHHAHAFNLFELRDNTLRYALGHIIEQADCVTVTARDVIQAVYTYSHVNDHGLWVQPESRSEVVVSRNESSDPASPLPGQPVFTPARLPAKPTRRRRRAPSPPAPAVSEQQPELKPSPDAAAAYVHVAAPDPPDPNAKEDWRAIANRFFGKVPRPNRDPNSTEKIYFDAYRTNPDPK
ncbi:MAG: hypothetical protein WAL95_14195 [Candidatus Acidiferrales bacterium]